MAATLTDVEKIRRLPWLVSGDVLNIIFVSLTFAGPVFILFLDQLGLGSAQIGFLLSLIPFCGVIALFIAPLVTRFGYKRVFITFWGVRKFVLLLTPVFLARFGAQAAFIWVAGIIFSFAICRAIAETARNPWLQEVIPDSIRGKFGAVSGMSTTMAAIFATIGASLVIGSGTGLGRFMILMAIGIGAGLLGVMAYSRAPAETQGGADGARDPRGGGWRTHGSSERNAASPARQKLSLLSGGAGTGHCRERAGDFFYPPVYDGAGWTERSDSGVARHWHLFGVTADVISVGLDV
jgi:hypothetical protein